MAEGMQEAFKKAGVDPKTPEHAVSLSEDGGTANVKTPIGGVKLALSEGDRMEILGNVKELQRVEIRAKKVAMVNTIATTILASLSAVAVGFTLFKGQKAEAKLQANGVK